MFHLELMGKKCVIGLLTVNYRSVLLKWQTNGPIFPQCGIESLNMIILLVKCLIMVRPYLIGEEFLLWVFSFR